MQTNTAHSLEDSLDEILDGDNVASEGFVIEDLESATWAARKREQGQRKVDEVRAVAAAHRAKIDAWEADATRADLERVAYFDGLLTFYHETIIRDEVAEGVDDKRLTKSIKLPGLTLTSRAAQATWQIDDEAFIVWAMHKAPNLIETKTTVKLAEVKKALTPSAGGSAVNADGVVAAGVTVEDRPRKFDVKPA